MQGRKHLDVLQRVKAEPAGDAILHQIDDQVGSPLGVVGGKEKKIGGGLAKEGRLALVDAVGIADDEAAFGLAKDLGQAHHGFRGERL
jgi:hypothetical protein